MTLQTELKKDLAQAMKDRDTAKKEALRVILGELSRADTKALEDKEVVRILKKLVKSEKELLNKREEQDSEYLQIIESYLPQMASEEQIKSWIRENIDFSQFVNRMQAMGPIMNHFGETADGNSVKTILQQWPN